MYGNQGPSGALVDIKDVRIDKNLPREQRIAEYVRQIKDPNNFRCGDFTVHIAFADNGVTLEDCLQRILE